MIGQYNSYHREEYNIIVAIEKIEQYNICHREQTRNLLDNTISLQFEFFSSEMTGNYFSFRKKRQERKKLRR